MIDKNKRLSGIKLFERDKSIVEDRIEGQTYAELSEKYKIKRSNLSRILNKPELKELIDIGTQQVISLTPLAIKVHYDLMVDKDNKALGLKAAETVLKTSAIVPSNTVNQTINNIYKQTNNLITDKTVNLVKKILPGFQVDEQEIVEIPA
jgi:hypothetical protein